MLRSRLEPTNSAGDESSLVLTGFVTFADKPLPDAAAALAALRAAGVRVKIITGDSDLVTWRVCTQVGLDPGRILLGEEIEKMPSRPLVVTTLVAVPTGALLRRMSQYQPLGNLDEQQGKSPPRDSTYGRSTLLTTAAVHAKPKPAATALAIHEARARRASPRS